MSTLRELFESQYPGIDSIYQNIVLPVFKNVSDKRKTSDKIEQIPESDKEQINSIKIIAQHTKGADITFVDVQIKDSVNLLKSRVAISRFTKNILEDQAGAIIFFHYANNKDIWRVSYVYKGTNSSDSTNAKRYTYLCGKSQHCRTIAERFEDLSKKERIVDGDIKTAFSVESVTKEFYQSLFAWYEWATDAKTKITFPKDNAEQNDNKENIDVKIIRLITRIMFVWFIKQKDLVPNELFDQKYLKTILKNFDPNSKTDGCYYNAILQNLFFATLNRAIIDEQGNKRAFAEKKGYRDLKNLYRYEQMFTISKEEIIALFSKVPFLNGGLFECLDKTILYDGVEKAYNYDGFSRNDEISKDGTPKWRANIPNQLFFAQEVGLFAILNRYNFTVEESSPSDVQVALDPELLGKVFENLLGSYNPETRESARKDSGSFYTPREIVNYMVDESLKNYLLSHSEQQSCHSQLVSESQYKEIINALFSSQVESIRLKDDVKKLIKDTLLKVKILDPACGSGAFPMGVLNRLVDLLLKIEPSQDVYNLKLQIIENCIYGVDIQSIAVQIAKLRFFISLICDSTKDDSKPNFGIPTLPNLETKFVCANSLFSINKKVEYNHSHALFESVSNIPALQNKLKEIRKAHFGAKNAKEKIEYREQDEQLRAQLLEEFKKDNLAPEDAKLLATWNPYDQNAVSPFFDADWMFGITDGFDIVIGNPPYIKEYENRAAFEKLKAVSPYYMGKMDIWYAFACHGIDLLNKGGHLCFIAQNNWTTSAGAKKLRNKVIECSKIKQLVDFNTYMVFESASIQTMIMLFEHNSKDDNYKFDLRTLKADSKKEDMLDLLEHKQTNFTQYLEPTIKRTSYKDKLLTFSRNDDLFEKIAKDCVYLQPDEATNGIHPHHDFVNVKIHREHEWTSVGQGIFGLSHEEKQSLNLSEKEELLVKPYYTSEQVGRYYTNPNNDLWIIYTDSSYKNPTKIKAYPNIKNHLDKFKKIITSDNKPYGLHRAREEHFFKGEKIVSLRKCVGRPSFSYSDFDCYVSATFYVIQTNRFNLKYLTGLLNSKLIAYWLKNKGKMQGSNYQIDKEPLMQIPLKNATQAQQQQIATLVDQILAIKSGKEIPKQVRNDGEAQVRNDGGTQTCNDGGAQADTSLLEHKIDLLVYALYGLTEEEIAIVEGK